MRIEALKEQLRAAGAKPRHETLVLRAWARGLELDAFAYLADFPTRLRAALPEISSAWRALVAVRSEHPSADGSPRARERDLGGDLGAAEMTLEPVAARHAEETADGATDLRGHAHAVAGQEHAFDRPSVAQREQQPRRSVRARVLRAHGDERVPCGRDVGQRGAQPRGEVREIRERVEREPTRPRAQHERLVARLRAGRAQLLLQRFDSHLGLNSRSSGSRAERGSELLLRSREDLEDRRPLV